jgi:hypothetical protein
MSRVTSRKLRTLTASCTNNIHAKNAGASRDRDGRPSARIAKVMWPANETESIVAWARKVHLETLEMPEGVRLREAWRENKIRMLRYASAEKPA